MDALPHQVIMQQLCELAKRALRVINTLLFIPNVNTWAETLPVAVFESLFFPSAIVSSHVHVVRVLYGWHHDRMLFSYS